MYSPARHRRKLGRIARADTARQGFHQRVRVRPDETRNGIARLARQVCDPVIGPAANAPFVQRAMRSPIFTTYEPGIGGASIHFAAAIADLQRLDLVVLAQDREALVIGVGAVAHASLVERARLARVVEHSHELHRLV